MSQCSMNLGLPHTVTMQTPNYKAIPCWEANNTLAPPNASDVSALQKHNDSEDCRKKKGFVHLKPRTDSEVSMPGPDHCSKSKAAAHDWYSSDLCRVGLGKYHSYSYHCYSCSVCLTILAYLYSFWPFKKMSTFTLSQLSAVSLTRLFQPPP